MRKKLEFQANRIETVLALHNVPARVTGGTVTPRWVRFQVLPVMGAKISKIKNLSEELATALDAQSCRVSRRGVAVAIEIPRDNPQPVCLLPLHRQLDPAEIPPVTATLGIAEDGAPLLIRLPSPDVAHIFVMGAIGAGKTMLLKSVILSLAMTNTQQEVTMLLIAPDGNTFNLFESLPHLVRPIIQEATEVIEALESLKRLMMKRANGNGCGSTGNHHIVVIWTLDKFSPLYVPI